MRACRAAPPWPVTPRGARPLAALLLLLAVAAASGAGGENTDAPTWHICTMIRRDARYLTEWLEYHALQGATSFSVYDHSSVDAPELGRVLAAYAGPHAGAAAAAGGGGGPWLEMVPWPPHTRAEGALLAAQRRWSDAREAPLLREGLAHCRSVMAGGGNPIGCQEVAKADCFARHGHHAAFLSFTDTDEFFVAPGSRVIAALGALRARHPRAGAFYMPSITWGSSHLSDLPAGRLVVETFTRRAPFAELGDDAPAITARNPNCSVAAKSFPGRTMCSIDHGKHIYVNRSVVFDVASPTARGFIERLRAVTLPTVTVPRSGPLRLFHYQHRGLADLAARGSLWGKGLNVEQALGAPGFWNAVVDTTLAGNATLLRALRAAIQRRQRLVDVGG